MRTKEELSALKKEMQTMNRKLSELSEDELTQIVGGHSGDADWCDMPADVCSSCYFRIYHSCPGKQ